MSGGTGQAGTIAGRAAGTDIDEVQPRDDYEMGGNMTRSMSAMDHYDDLPDTHGDRSDPWDI